MNRIKAIASEKSSSEVPPIISRSSGSFAVSALASSSPCFAIELATIRHDAFITFFKLDFSPLEFSFAKFDMYNLFNFDQDSVLDWDLLATWPTINTSWDRDRTDDSPLNSTLSDSVTSDVSEILESFRNTDEVFALIIFPHNISG